MDPFTSVVEYDRRADLLEQLAATAQRGIDWEVAKKREQHKLDEITTTDKEMRRNNYWWQFLGHLKTVGLRDTLSLLDSYETETLELLARKFTTINGELDCLQSLRSFNGKEWNTVAGEHRDVMFRDIIALRRYGWTKAEHMVHSLLDTYRALDLQPGDIHAMPVDDADRIVAPIYKTAFSSRSVIWLRYGLSGSGAKMDRFGNFSPPVEQEVREDYRRQHLTPEIIEYVMGRPDRFQPLRDHMMKTRETLYEMDFELFLIKQGTHASLSDGVL